MGQQAKIILPAAWRAIRTEPRLLSKTRRKCSGGQVLEAAHGRCTRHGQAVLQHPARHGQQRGKEAEDLTTATATQTASRTPVKNTPAEARGRGPESGDEPHSYGPTNSQVEHTDHCPTETSTRRSTLGSMEAQALGASTPPCSTDGWRKAWDQKTTIPAPPRLPTIP